MHPWHDSYVDDALVEAAFPVIIEVPKGAKNKYELDKETGLLRLDRVLYSAVHYPADYGFIPRTYCGANIAALCPGAQRGDGDPLDVCVLSERPITRAEIIVPARVVGGLQLLDRGEADDKIIAVLEGDFVWGNATELADLPPIMVERLQHYFNTYKLVPGAKPQISVQSTYGAEHAARVVQAALADYRSLLAEL